MKVTLNNLEKEEVIDWNKVQLVMSKITNMVYLTLDVEMNKHSDKFKGMDFSGGIINEFLVKENFKPFRGSITLQND
jgi:hypothetical protein